MATRAEIEEIKKAQVEAILRAQGQFMFDLAAREPRPSKAQLLASPFTVQPADRVLMAQNRAKEASWNTARQDGAPPPQDIHEPGLAIPGAVLVVALVLVFRMIRRIWD